MAACTIGTALKVRQYDDGVKLIVQIVDCTVNNNEAVEDVVDISQMLSAEILLGKPSGESVVVPAQLLTDGTDGKIYYATKGNPDGHYGDLDEVGTWSIQGRVKLQNGTYTTRKGKFKVEEVLDNV